MQDPNHRVTWKPLRPDFAITYLRGTSTNRGYHESWFEVVSRRSLEADDFKRLDECGLLGLGQCYNIESTEEIIDVVPPVTVDQRTGEVLDLPPMGLHGLITTKTPYTYQRTVVKRICDSGD